MGGPARVLERRGLRVDQPPFFLARTHLESARLYKERGQADDPTRQAHHLALAVDLGREHGLARVQSQALELTAAAAAR